MNKNKVRQFRRLDFEWIKPIADQWQEWESAKRILEDRNNYALVIEPWAVGVLYEDQHGVVLEGTCSKKGIKAIHKLGLELVKLAEQNEINLHSHCVNKKSWQYKFFTRYLEFNEYNGMLMRYAVRGGQDVFFKRRR